MGGGQVTSRSGGLLGASVSMIGISSESPQKRQIGSPPGVKQVASFRNRGRRGGVEGETGRTPGEGGDRGKRWKPKAEQEQITNGECIRIASESSGLWQRRQLAVPASAVLLPPLPRESGLGVCSGGHRHSWLSAERGGEELKTVPCKEKAGFAYKGHSKCAKGGIWIWMRHPAI